MFRLSELLNRGHGSELWRRARRNQLTSGDERDHRARLALRHPAVARHPEVICGAARRRRPEVRRLGGVDVVGQRHPLSHRLVLDHVVLYRHWSVLWRRPAYADPGAQLVHRHVNRRSWNEKEDNTVERGRVSEESKPENDPLRYTIYAISYAFWCIDGVLRCVCCTVCTMAIYLAVRANTGLLVACYFPRSRTKHIRETTQESWTTRNGSVDIDRRWKAPRLGFIEFFATELRMVLTLTFIMDQRQG